MGSRLPPYPAYRDSGLGWLPQLPAHWEVRRNGRLFAQRVETGREELPILEVSLRTGVRVRTFGEGGRKQVMADRAKYKRAAAGDIAYNMMRLWQGAVGVVPEDGLVSPAYVVAAPYEDVEPRYFAYLFRTADYMREVEGFSRGIVADRNRLYWGQFKQMPSPYPPMEEQRRIADYLDAHGRLTNRLIRNRRALLRTLAERRLSTIATELLGITAAQASPSIQAWGDDLPAHWHMLTLRRVSDVRVSGVDKLTSPNEIPVRLCNYVDVYRNDLITDDLAFMDATATEAEIARFSLAKGDIVITKDSEAWNDIAVPAFVDADLEGVVCGYHLAIVRPDRRQIDPEFLFFALRSPQIMAQFHVAATGVTRFGLSQLAMKNVVLPIPPLDEQVAIAVRIKSKLSSLVAAERRLAREIVLANEYRERLIADAVTGRLDLRAATISASVADDDRDRLPLEDDPNAAGDEAEDDSEAALAESEE